MSNMKIDAHQHFWQFDPVRDAWMTEGSMSAIRQDFLPTDLQPILQKNGYDGCIAVQADQSENETHFLLDLAYKNDFIKGVVGWVDLQANDISERLNYFSQFSKLKGFRHILQGEKPEFMLQKSFIEGAKLLGERGYTYDILVFPRHLSAVHKFLQTLDNQPFVIDHLAKPYIERSLIKQWKRDMQRIAKHENVWCKVSGMVTEANWSNWQVTDFEPYLDVIFEAFGVDRIMYGSDWPVCLLATSYDKQLSIVENYLSKLSNTEGGKVFGGNAQLFY